MAGHHRLYGRIHTVMTALDFPVVTPESAHRMFRHMCSEDHLARFEKIKDTDFSYEIPGLGRFRAVNARHRSGMTVAIAMRAIKEKIPAFKDLNLPEVVQRLTYLPRGLILVTGDTGSGKSTTLAAMIQAMNERYQAHIITLEDPVEYKLQSLKCTIEQRELGDDVPSFASGLRHVLRQDPDIILVGEMRDLETTAAAITAAETGHLVLSTLHTVNASQTVELHHRHVSQRSAKPDSFHARQHPSGGGQPDAFQAHRQEGDGARRGDHALHPRGAQPDPRKPRL